MTRLEAIEQMKAGQTLAHKYFTDDEWVKSNKSGTIFTLEDGIECSSQEFWQWRREEYFEDGWEIFEN